MSGSDSSTGDLLFALLQRCLPTRFISWIVFKLTRLRSKSFKEAAIRWFIRSFEVDMKDAETTDIAEFADFNAFFTRALRDDTRPIDPGSANFVSPVDGTVSQLGVINDDRIFQAKGRDYSVEELIGNASIAAPFKDGSFCTIYLAPYNYHRIHMPFSGQLAEWLYIPGRLFSVSPSTARSMPRLFARNERLVSVFETEFGPMALVMVGALNVGSMETVWAGTVTPPHRRRKTVVRGALESPPFSLQKGEEMGRFNMGSTVILLSPPETLNWYRGLAPGSTVRMGETIAELQKSEAD